MKINFRLIRLLIVVATLAGVVSCGVNEPEKDTEVKQQVQVDPRPVVEMKTSLGTIQLELDRVNAPITTDNFLSYVEQKHYDNTIFHRVIETFMIQGGGFEKGENPTEKPTRASIKNEAKTNGLKNRSYSIAMARTSEPDSATSQFFINVVDNRRTLDAGGSAGPDGYAVFGRVIRGKEVVDQIKAVEVGTQNLTSWEDGDIAQGPHQNVPLEQVVIESVRVLERVPGTEKAPD